MAAMPDGGTRISFSQSVSVQGSGRWLGRTTSVQYNTLEYSVEPGSGASSLPSQKATAGTFVRFNNLLPVVVPVVVGALAVATYMTGGSILNALQQYPGLEWVPVR